MGGSVLRTSAFHDTHKSTSSGGIPFFMIIDVNVFGRYDAEYLSSNGK